MNADDLHRRNKKFILDVIGFSKTLPKTEEFRIINRQLLRATTSVGANYRSACRARSKREFYSKLCIVVEEIDEANFWIDLLADLLPLDNDLKKIEHESLELLKIYSASRKKAQE